MLILASQSPRRKELLERAGITFKVEVAGIPEAPGPGESAENYVRRLSRQKAEAVTGDPVLGADTVVVVDGAILEKPADGEDARRMLKILSGRAHVVLTGVCLRQGDRMFSEVCETSVHFAQLSEMELEEYVASGEPMDKAGAYGIQGLASRFIHRIEGDYLNVVGLPVAVVYRLLKQAGVVPS
jgi:septum formation protein